MLPTLHRRHAIAVATSQQHTPSSANNKATKQTRSNDNGHEKIENDNDNDKTSSSSSSNSNQTEGTAPPLIANGHGKDCDKSPPVGKINAATNNENANAKTHHHHHSSSLYNIINTSTVTGG